MTFHLSRLARPPDAPLVGCVRVDVATVQPGSNGGADSIMPSSRFVNGLISRCQAAGRLWPLTNGNSRKSTHRRDPVVHEAHARRIGNALFDHRELLAEAEVVALRQLELLDHVGRTARLWFG